MHDHNKDGGGNGMMWMMVICCAVPLVLIVLFGLGGKALGAPIWIILGAVAVMAIFHFISMGKSHKHSDEEQATDGEQKDNKEHKDHSGHGCCH